MKRPMKRRSFVALATTGLATTATTAFAGAAFAQGTYPDKPITMVVPAPPGGGTDLVTRLYSDLLSQELGVQVIVDNKGGGNGNIGTALVARARPDGYTLLMQYSAYHSANPALIKDLNWKPDDFVGVAMGAVAPHVIVVAKKVPVDDLKSFIAYAKANPGKINFGSAGLATITQLYGEIFNIEAGVKMVHVPYKGSAPATVDLLSGQIQVQFDPTTLPHIAAGRLKCFAVLGEKRWPGKPDVPTLKEQGLGKMGGDAWYGILAAKGTPQVAVDRLSRAIGEAVKDPALNERLVTSGNYSSFQDTATFQATIERERVSFGEIIKTANIKI